MSPSGRAAAAARRRRYARQGYLVIPAVLASPALARLRAALASVMCGARRLRYSTDKFLIIRGGDGARHVTRVRDPIRHHRAFRALAVDPHILDVVESLIGPDIQLQQSRLILKPRVPSAWFDWHQDFPAYPHTNFDLLVVTVYLDDATAANGCLRVVPGSHRLGPLPHRFISEGAPRTELVDRRVVGDHRRWRHLAVPAGGVTVHHANLLHSSAANETDRPRTTVQFWYRAADNVQVGGATDAYGWGLQVRGVDRGVVRMAAGVCRLPGRRAIRV